MSVVLVVVEGLLVEVLLSLVLYDVVHLLHQHDGRHEVRVLRGERLLLLVQEVELREDLVQTGRAQTRVVALAAAEPAEDLLDDDLLRVLLVLQTVRTELVRDEDDLVELVRDS